MKSSALLRAEIRRRNSARARAGGSCRFRNSAVRRCRRSEFLSAECSQPQPRSKVMSGAAMMVWARPPTRSRASSTMMERPEFSSACAAPRPAAPAPMMATSTSEGRDMDSCLYHRHVRACSAARMHARHLRDSGSIRVLVLRHDPDMTISIAGRPAMRDMALAYATASLAFSARLRSLASRNFLRSRIDFGVTSTSSSSSI